MTFVDRWANLNNVTIHYLESVNYNENLTPLVYVPGALNYAEQSIELLNHFIPRRCISMSLRGRGNSAAPTDGYSFNDHVQDINNVVLHSQLNDYCLMAYSMGVPYAIKFATTHTNIKAMILCDYPPTYPLIPESWVNHVVEHGLISKEKKYVVEEIQKQSGQINLLDELSTIKIPVLLIKGGTEQSLLHTDEVDKYRHHLSNVTITEIANVGHNSFDSKTKETFKVIQQFLEQIDVR